MTNDNAARAECTGTVNIMGDGPDGKIMVEPGVGAPGARPIPGAVLSMVQDLKAMSDEDIAAALRRAFDMTAAIIAKAHLAGIQTNFNIGDATNGFAVTCLLQKVTTEVVDETTTRTTVKTL
jgi:hypothetical protein